MRDKSPLTTDDRRSDLLIRVASMYYERDYSQQKIADVLNTSRSNVSRLLKEAKTKGFVEIRVHKRVATAVALEQALVDQFDIEAALVFEGGNLDYHSRLERVGLLAARHLETQIEEGDTLAISWGTAVASAVGAFPVMMNLHTDVVQMIGTVGRVDSIIDGPDLSRELANKLGGQHYYLNAPLFVDSASTRAIFLQQPIIAETLSMARKAQVALVGIGTTVPGKSSFLRARHLSEADLDRLRAQGAVGEVSGQHFDIEGNADGIDLNERVIGLTAAEIRRIPRISAVACGAHKVQSILGALRGGYLSALATDDMTATEILRAAIT